MARGEITGKKPPDTNPNKLQPVPTLAMSIPQFCIAHNISEGMYYKMKKQDRSLVPREMNVGTRTLITFEAAAEWRAEREAASAEAKAKSPTPLPAPVPSVPPVAARAMANCASRQAHCARDQRPSAPVDRLTSPPKITTQRG